MPDTLAVARQQGYRKGADLLGYFLLQDREGSFPAGGHQNTFPARKVMRDHVRNCVCLACARRPLNGYAGCALKLLYDRDLFVVIR